MSNAKKNKTGYIFKMNPDAAVHRAGSAFFEHGILPIKLTVLWGELQSMSMVHIILSNQKNVHIHVAMS